MGKRKHDEAYYEEKINKLKRKLRRTRRSPSSVRSVEIAGTPSPSPPPPTHEHATTSPHVRIEDPPTCTRVIEPMVGECRPSTSTDFETSCIPEEGDILPAEYLLALGEEGVEKEEVGPALQAELALRWARIMKKGLGKEARDNILKKYPIPSNFQSIAPKLNPEIKIIMSEITLKRDARISSRQNITGKILSCLGKCLSKVVKGNINVKDLVEEINDGAKLASELFFQDSSSRKFFALAGANKEIKEGVKNTETDEYLFGMDCAEKIKSAQALKRTGVLIQNKKAAIQNQTKTQNTKQGNWRSPLPQHQRVRSGQQPKNHQKPQLRNHQKHHRKFNRTRPHYH